MKRCLFLLLFFIFLLPPVFAYQNSTTWCLEANVSQVIANGTVSENITCNFGCNSFSGVCNPNPYDPSIFYLFFPAVSIVLLYFTSLLKEEDWFIHIILIAAAMFFLVVPLGVLTQSFSHLSGLYWLTIVITIIVIFYDILRVIIGGVKAMQK